jgi:putative DNA primase/helicase
LGAFRGDPENETTGHDMGGAQPVDIPPTAPPWDEKVDAKEVLDLICAAISRFVWMKPPQCRAVALWIVLSYLHDVVDILPLLLITSPEEECGKTTLAELIYNLSNRPIAASNISSAPVYRTIKDDCPTLILDEADTYLREDEILRGVINSGHKRKFAFVIRVVNDKGDTGQFTTWCPKTIAMIGLPKRTILSRSIHNRLGRKPKNIKTEKLKEEHYQEFEELRRKISRLANDIRGHVKAFKDESLDNRAGDNWQPLFAIAAAAGEEWLQEAKLAAQRISKKDAEEMKGFGRYLLESLDHIIQEKRKSTNLDPAERIFLRSLDLCNELNQDQEAPWKNKPDGIDALRLSKALKQYDIVPTRAREGSDRSKGYWSDEIEKAIQQYAGDTG